jgi:hypothetical protein
MTPCWTAAKFFGHRIELAKRPELEAFRSHERRLCHIRIIFGALGEAMVEKALLVEPHQNTLVCRPGIMVVGAFLLFIGETVGTAQELPTGTIGLSGRAFIEPPGSGGISYPAGATHNDQATASPGQWLIDDVARERAKFELRQVSPMPLSATNARDAAHIGAGVGSPSSDERRAQEVSSSIGIPTVEDGTLGTHRSQRALKRSNSGPDPSPGLIDSATKSVEAPVGLTSEGEHWYYRLDRETHQKCWYVRAFKEDRERRSSVENDRRLSETTLPDPSIRIRLGGAGDDR